MSVILTGCCFRVVFLLRFYSGFSLLKFIQLQFVWVRLFLVVSLFGFYLSRFLSLFFFLVAPLVVPPISGSFSPFKFLLFFQVPHFGEFLLFFQVPSLQGLFVPRFIIYFWVPLLFPDSFSSSRYFLFVPSGLPFCFFLLGSSSFGFLLLFQVYSLSGFFSFWSLLLIQIPSLLPDSLLSPRSSCRPLKFGTRDSIEYWRPRCVRVICKD